MKIAYILPSLSSAAPIAVIELLSNLMIQNGHTCCVYYFDDKTGASFACNTEQISAKKSLDFSKFDIVHSTGMRPDKYVAKFREHGGKTKYLTTIHNFFIEDFTSQYNWFVAQVYGRLWMKSLTKLDCVVTLSNVGVRYYQKWITKSKLTFAYNARLIDSSLELSVDEKRVLFALKGSSTLIGINAMLSPIKGVDQIIKALSELPGHKLFVVGDGKSRGELEHLAEKLGVVDRVYFAGFCKDAYRYLAHYDIYAMPSRSEGFGLSLIEAAQYKVPAVCSNIPIFEEIFDANEVAFFELDNTASLVDAIKKATNNKELGENMYLRYQACYTPEKMYERYLSIYNGTV